MSYTPVELRHVKVGRTLFGYNRATVEQLIEEVAQSFEATWRERGELADQVESLEKQITELRSREHLLTQTLIAAEQAASDVRERARREAEAIVSEAHNEARSIGRAAHRERERLFLESKRIQGMLRAALGIVESETAATSEPVVPVPEPEPQPEPEVPMPAALVGSEPMATAPVEQPAPVSVVLAAPLVPTVEPEPEIDRAVEPEAENEYGWSREDTREFEPLSALPDPEPEPDARHEEPAAPVGEPALHPIRGGGSRDFDWGE
jgi:hypothetical protein